MFRSRIVSLLTAAGMVTLLSSVAYGQRWEVGAGGGASFYNAKTLTTTSGDISAKFKPGYSFSGYLGQIGGRLGGEVRYSYMSNEMELAGLGKSYTMSGRSQAIHYDVHIYFNKNQEAKIRTYVLAGGGIKQFSGTGSTVPYQPLGNLAVLTNTSQWKPLVTAGAGVRVALSPHMQLRGEVRGYFTEMPTDVITPVSGSLGGWLFDIAPTVSVSYVW
ncbi:outer membrane beta-barrel protein [uncultured Paludibaculum sp.]|uniref:outer membrane beta-barrel protein n=1 Tax=uncultured Paludibaculum sp. TaxID=1765020 RepID=UPI002AAA96B6|nr:outer membrane beta-barrel protein [uncultured Paludibaculum sp.]